MSDILTPQITEAAEAVPSTGNAPGSSKNDTTLPPESLFKLKEYFNLPYSDYQANDQLKFMIDYFLNRGATGLGDILMGLRETELQIGQTDNKLSAVYRYLRLQGTIDELTKQKRAIR